MPDDDARPDERDERVDAERADAERHPEAADEPSEAELSEAERREREIREEQRVSGGPPLEHLASGRYDEESEELREEDRNPPIPPA